MRTCKKCGAEKPLKQFPVSDHRTGGRRHECRSCYTARHKAYYAARPKDYRQRSRKAYALKRRQWLKTPEGVTWRRQQNKRLNAANRAKVLDAYGRRCACCGEATERFLTVDHVASNGKEMRQIHGTGNSFYMWLIRRGFPVGFQVLCFNCNIGRSMNGGICPHKEGSTTRA